jgi:hypothetical protein
VEVWKHVSIEEARCGGPVLGRRVVVSLYWGGVLWWACIGEACCGGLSLERRVAVGLCLGRRAVVRMVVGSCREDGGGEL